MILQTVASINPAIGGPAVSVVRLALELQHTGESIKLATLDYTEHGVLPKLPNGMLQSVPCHFLTRTLRGWSPTLRRQLFTQTAEAAIVHNHGIWMFPNHYAAAAARRSHKPLITSPRGMLGSWALSYHSWPKKLLWHLRERQDLRSVTAFHATSAQEAEDIRQAGFTQPIAIIPNGVDLPLDSVPDRLLPAKSLPQLQGKRLALFLSRIHPKKGLIELVDAWALLPPDIRKNWLLLIAGPDLTNHLPAVAARIREQKMETCIQTHPPVSGSLKQFLLETSEIFILPSHEENFGIVVAEALAHGTPVIATHGTPWESLITHHCGWWIPLSVNSLQETLGRALVLSPEILKTMGASGQVYARKELSWTAIAGKMSLFYNWVLQGGAAPDFIRID
jgi:glycosyltransferase involved in cell wall biosynthesis